MAKDPNSAKTGAQVERKVVSWWRGENGGVESGVHEALATWPNGELIASWNQALGQGLRLVVLRRFGA